ncbi:MAG: hypothetical protein HW412_406 [Bacteroidetes bacterium]|nr:hypothetical protein [Bacteroidota bacterium]
MKRMVVGFVLVIAAMTQSFGQYPIVTVRQVEQQPPDSLILADSLQLTQAGRWPLQASQYIRHTSPFAGDTVTIVALCVVRPKVLTFTGSGYTMLVYDTTSNPYPFGGLFVRCSSDTASHIADGFLNVTRGMVIAMTGLVSEFPSTYHSVTQFQPIPGIPITILAAGRPIPPPPVVNLSSFYTGIFPGGRPRISTGEPYEGLMVTLTNLTLDVKVNPGRGTFSAVDASGNQITDYDASKFFTLGHGTIVGPPDSVWAIRYPALAVGTRIDTIRGYITTVSGAENPRGYRIAPIERGDIVFGLVLPSITTHRRNPVVVPSDSAARISVVARKQTGGFGIASVSLVYSVNNTPFISLPMTLSDTTYKANIPQQVQDAFVKYFMKAVDSSGNQVILASSAFGGAVSDTSKGFFFYNVLNRPLTIRDIQYTPFLNGRGAYQGATISVAGVVTADTANISRSPRSTLGTNSWYMQNGTQPWNGIWFDDSTAASANAVRNGDSVSITGVVREDFDVTQVWPFTAAPIVRATGRPLPPPVVLTTGTFGPAVGNGTPSAEQWEGMLVRFNTVQVTDTTQWYFADPTEFAVDDGSGAILVRRDGRHRYTNQAGDTLGGRILIRPGHRISFLQGVLYFSANRYKLVPRTDADWGTVTGVDIQHDPVIPATYSLDQNYPNPFNPSTFISYALPANAHVTLKVYNLLGQEVRTLVAEHQIAGKYTVRLDGSSLATGVYFYHLHAGEFSQVKKLLLLK